MGKFAQRAEADPETYRTISNLHEFAVADQRGQVSYHHAAYTWQFIEEHLSWLTRVGNGDGNIAQWAARHHKPSSVWDWIVAEADRLSAGMDRGHLDEAAGGWASVQSARLIPLLARIGGATSSDHHSVPMRPLAMDDGLFPQAATALASSAVVDDYRALFGHFVQAVDRIQTGDIASFLQTFLSVYERYAWCVPAAANTVPRDISLIEHSRAASAIAAVLTAELYDNGTPTIEQVRDRNARRYTLAVGNVGGIQRFLYTIVIRNAARALRGRSLALQLLTDAIAHRFLDALGLPSPCLLYNGGGKIWLLLPASARDTALEMARSICNCMRSMRAACRSRSASPAYAESISSTSTLQRTSRRLRKTCKLAVAVVSQSQHGSITNRFLHRGAIQHPSGLAACAESSAGSRA